MFLPDWFAAGDRTEAGSKNPLALSRDEQLKQLASITGKPRCFPCPDCGKSFRNNYEFKRHYMIHTGAKPHKCQFCGRSFRQRPHLKRHWSFHHPEALFGGKLENNKPL